MTLLHVICGLGPPIKNPGYPYARDGIKKSLTEHNTKVTVELGVRLESMACQVLALNLELSEDLFLLKKTKKRKKKHCLGFNKIRSTSTGIS